MKFFVAVCLLLCSLFVIPYSAFSQDRAIVMGQVLDSESHKPLQDVTVMISRLKDSSNTNKIITDKNGWFRFSDVTMKDTLLLDASYSGMDEFQGLLIATQKRFVTQPVLMHPVSKSLEGVTVTATPRLMVIKGDTVEFKASNYKLAPNAMAEDLIKRLPGLTIDQQGKLFFNGRPVTTILVDGKVFFNSDGGIALSNIPTDIIDKIQVTDTKTEEEKLLGQPAKGGESTLNIKLKSGNKFFGNASAGAGTDNRYEGSGLVSIMRKGQQLNFLGGINNTNSVIGKNNRSLAAITQGGGITRTISSGFGYNDTLGSQTALELNYIFTRPVTYRETVLQAQQDILPDSSLYNSSVSDYLNKEITHALDLKLSNSKKGFSIGSSLINDRQDNHSQITQSTMGQNNVLLNALSNSYESKANSLKWNSGFTYDKKISQKGRLLSVYGVAELERRHEHDLNSAATYFYKSNVIDSQSILLQGTDLINNSSEFTVGTRYYEPINRYLSFTVGHRFTYVGHSSSKTTQNLDANNQPIGIDTLYSNAFNSFVRINNTLLDLIYYKKRLYIRATVLLSNQYQHRIDLSRQDKLSYSIFRALPFANLNYSSAKNDNISLECMSSNNYPTLDQLQPVQDNSNPLLIKKGNPALKPATRYQNLLMYRKMFPGKKPIMLNSFLTFTPVIDQIVASVSYDNLARQLVQYRNINGTYTVKAALGGTITLPYGKNLFKISANTASDYSHAKQYLNGLPFVSNLQTVTYTLTLNYSRGPVVDIYLSYHPASTVIYYEQNAAVRRHYLSQSIEGSINLFLFKHIKWMNAVNYLYNGDIASGLKKNSTLCTAQLSWLCLHNQKGEIKLIAFDILKQNRNISRTITASSITDTQTNNMQQYFLLGFAYHFDVLKK